MTFLYHRIPEQMQGDVLYPLNQLKDIFPDAYSHQVKKYEGREGILNRKMPLLDCLWNDVLHLSAVNPREVDDEVTKYGRRLPDRKFLKINPSFLEEEKTVVYLYRKWEKPEDFSDPENWEKYSPSNVGAYEELSDITKEYYRTAIQAGGVYFVWHTIPHILYKGTLDIREHEVVEI